MDVFSTSCCTACSLRDHSGSIRRHAKRAEIIGIANLWEGKMKLLRNSGLSTLSLIICLCLPCFGADYNYGLQLFFSPPAYSTFGTIYSFDDPEDSITAGIQEFMASHYIDSDGHVYKANDFFFERIIRLIRLKSVYISAYSQNYKTYKELFVLTDLSSNNKFILNTMTLDEYNNFIQSHVPAIEDINYISRLFIVLTNIGERIYFIKYIDDVLSAYEIPQAGNPSVLFSIDATNSFIRNYENRIKNNTIQNSDTTVISQCIYNLGKREVKEYTVSFVNYKMIQMDTRVVVNKEEVEELYDNSAVK